MLRTVLSFIGWIFSWVTIGVVLVALIVGAILFMYGKDLPDHKYLVSYEPKTISKVYSIEGKVMDEFAQERRLYTPVDEIPAVVRNGFISAEDKGFYQHKGYDPIGIIKAVIDKARGGRLRGASTISQQVAKIMLLNGDRKYERKIKELILSTRIETTLGKDRILEIYLNEIFLGQNSYGVTAASEVYFGKSLENVTIEEAAYLAALPKAPSDYHPVKERKREIGRAHV